MPCILVNFISKSSLFKIVFIHLLFSLDFSTHVTIKDKCYEKVKIKIRNGNFRDQEVRSFIKSLQDSLKRMLDIFQEIQADPDYPDRSRVEEITRRTLRDYQKLLTIYIEEENNDGKD